MAHIVEYSEFTQKRLQKLKAKAHRTPHQRASETILMREGYAFERVTPAGSLLYKQSEGPTIYVALIAPDGSISKNKWIKE